MSTPARPIRITIGTLRIVAGSAIEARRLADALPAALERALSTSPGGAPGSPADRVAAAVANEIRSRLGEAR